VIKALPHPSAQALLVSAKDNGRGMKLAELERRWEARLREILACEDSRATLK
jgi:hypothetical protein